MPHPDDNIWIWVDAVAQYEEKMWIVDDRRCSDGSLLIYHIYRNGVHQMKLRGVSREMNFTLLCIPQRCCMEIVLGEDIEDTKTKIWFDLKFEQLGTNVKYVDIDGQGLGWSHDGKTFLLWKIGDNGMHQLHLCSTEDMKSRDEDSSFSIVEMTLGVGILYVKASYFTMNDYLQDGSGRPTVDQMPCVAVLAVLPKGAFLSLWDTSTNKVTKEIDLSMLQVSLNK